MFTAQQLLNKSREELLDLSTRNRLLSIPVDSTSARIIQVRSEMSEQVFRLLVDEKTIVSFAPGRRKKVADEAADEQEEEEFGLPLPDEDHEPSAPVKKHSENRLQTSLSPEGLHRRLFDLHHDARTMIEEQGVNILYLALGHLKWFEADNSDSPRFAPLLLIPVELSRKSASERFVLQWNHDEFQENLSLRAKLKHDFDIDLPEFPDEEDLNLPKYFEAVARTVAGAKGWEVLPNEITLGFFSFAKFLMYRDLDPKNWPNPSQLLDQPFIKGLLQDGFPHSESLLPDDTKIDDIIPASKLDHVVDADGSQTLALEAVRQARSMVIQGPPGTGKSQSITNIIATAVLDGKRVLFVAEKLAALEVVKRRLERENLGALCLELHSNKSNKRAVIEEIGRTWKLGRPKATDLEALIPQLEHQRTVLNDHAVSLHEKQEPSGLTPFSIMGHLAVLGTRGQEAGELTFLETENWTAEERRKNRSIIEEIAQRIEQIGLPSQHPWRGVCREAVLAIDLDPLLKQIQLVMLKAQDLKECSSKLAVALSQRVPQTFREVEEQAIIADFVAKAPPLDKQALCNSVWNAGLDGLRDVIAEGRKFAAAQEQTRGKVSETVWEKNFSEARSQIAAHGKSLFRFLNGPFRLAMAEVRGSLTGAFPKGHDERLQFIDVVISGQKALQKIREVDSVSKEAFGSLWRKEKTNWNELETVVDWVVLQNEAGLGASFRRMFADVQDQTLIHGLVEELGKKISVTHQEVEILFRELALDCRVAFGVAEIRTLNVDLLFERCQKWTEHREDLSRWNNYFIRARNARKHGLGSLIEALENKTMTSETAINCFDRIYFSQLLRIIVRKKPELAQFDGALHDKHVANFKQLDRERLALAKYRTLVAHHTRMPPLNAGVGAAGIVKAEMERKRGHRTVRRLLKDAGSVVQAIKPVFMMSPLSIAQFLEPGAVEFDILVIDEASQVLPVDAFGAIARCKQIVVVGDSKQLPPTRFFSRMTSNTEDAEEQESAVPQTAQAQDIESILGLCRARGLPEAMLRWHYRSRHHSLIAVSNHEFYEDKLFIVPSPYSAASGLGLKFNHVPDGVFDSGASGTNRIEAKAICQAIIEHARTNPKLSLGVVAFSVRQQQAIHDELELLRQENHDTEGFFTNHATEPFFVKNLENVQGDERDVIFISVGYGKDVSGYMAMRFGPLSNEGGERRLNVLISRAKLRCEVFASITADDIDLNRATGRGVAALKTFLSFARTGRLSTPQISGREEDSPFEEAVRRAVESLGYEVHPQVGIAGFYIDLGVLDKNHGGRYLLGIECDGAAYHSSRSARDRDRLRQAVLEDHGWIIHRIWSTDWFQRPNEQLRKVAEAIERAKIAIEQSESEEPQVNQVEPFEFEEEIDREDIFEKEDPKLSGFSVPYTQAQFQLPTRLEPHQLSTKDLAAIVCKIVEIEGPIHENEILNRVRDLWGFARSGARIQEAVAKAVRSLLVTKQCSREDGFVAIFNAPVLIRNREALTSSELRRPEMLPPSELRAAILRLIEAGHGAAKCEIPTAISRMLGFKIASASLKSVIETQMKKLIRQNIIAESNGMLKRVDNSSTNQN